MKKDSLYFEADLFGPLPNDHFEQLLQSLRDMIEEVIGKWELPPRGVIISSNHGREGMSNEGKIVSYSILINEPEYPAAEEDLLDERRTKNPCVTFKLSSTKTRRHFIEVTLRTAIFEQIVAPGETITVKVDSVNDNKTVAIPLEANGVLDFFRQVVELKLRYYKSATASRFGCCSLFEECSDARRCIHPNRLYSTACAYRHNLENGRIFYGKNRNFS